MATLIVPAAGEGSRLGCECPKALVDLGGRPLIDRILSAADGRVDRVVVVIQPRQLADFEAWRDAAEWPVEIAWAFQESPTGSLDAVRIGVEGARAIDGLRSGVVIVWADQVGVGADTFKLLSDAVATPAKLLAVPLFETSSPYVWVDLDGSGRIIRVGRTRDGDIPPAVALADLGIFGLSESLAPALLDIAEDAAGSGERELDFTYALPTLSALADVTLLPRVTDERQLIAVNTLEDLDRAREVLGRRDD